jgi:hypothetical protein
MKCWPCKGSGLPVLTRLASVLLGGCFEFVAPLGLSDCITRLERRSEQRNILYPLKVYIWAEDNGTYSFMLRKEVVIGRYVYAHIIGELQAQNERSTVVRGETGFNRAIYILLFSTVIGMVMAISMALGVQALVLISILWIVTIFERDRLARIVYQTLTVTDEQVVLSAR